MPYLALSDLFVLSSKQRLRIQHKTFGGGEPRGGLLLVGVPQSGVNLKGFEMSHGQGQLHLFGFQVRPDSRSRLCGSGRGWKQGNSFLKGAVVRFGRRGGVGFLSEGSG